MERKIGLIGHCFKEYSLNPIRSVRQRSHIPESLRPGLLGVKSASQER